jgi:hypothetical protein
MHRQRPCQRGVLFAIPTPIKEHRQIVMLQLPLNRARVPMPRDLPSRTRVTEPPDRGSLWATRANPAEHPSLVTALRGDRPTTPRLRGVFEGHAHAAT